MTATRRDAVIGARPRPPLPSVAYRATRAEAEALVAEALGEHPPLPGLGMGANAVRLLASAWYCHGSLRLPRGWVAPAMRAMFERGLACPNAKCWRSYRSHLQENPGRFLTTPGVPVDLLEQLELDLDGAGG